MKEQNRCIPKYNLHETNVETVCLVLQFTPSVKPGTKLRVKLLGKTPRTWGAPRVYKCFASMHKENPNL
jgi:hypothetical protein